MTVKYLKMDLSGFLHICNRYKFGNSEVLLLSRCQLEMVLIFSD